MGKFSDRVRKILNPKKQEHIEALRSLGLNDDARIIPASQLKKPHDTYFIRVVGKPNTYVKFFNGEYITQDGPELACLWSLADGTKYIENVLEPPLELIRLDQLKRQAT